MNFTMKRKDWLKDNITSLLAIVWSFASIGVYFIILTKEIKADDKMTFLVISNQNAIVLLILGYYYVSSKLTSDKQKKEEESTKETTTLIETKTPLQP